MGSGAGLYSVSLLPPLFTARLWPAFTMSSGKMDAAMKATGSKMWGVYNNLATVSVFQVVATLSAAAILGYAGHDKFHDTEEAICFVNQTALSIPGHAATDLTRPEDCFDSLSKLQYGTIAILCALVAFIGYGFLTGRGIRGPLDSAVMGLVRVTDEGGYNSTLSYA